MPTNNEDVYEYVHAAQRTGMFKMLKVEFILSVLSVMLILVSLLLTLTILNLIFVNSYYALSLLYLVWFLVFGAILLISNRLPTRD